MAKIRILPTHIANQIAAGEVIERPASIIKELLENAIDAGADTIEVNIENGGKVFISVKDNGTGIEKDDLKICLMHHSTSKLDNDNLSNIITLGFRGEALSSIASVSKIEIASKHKDQSIGYCISASNGAIGKVEPTSIQCGTLVVVKDLFFCLPARLKFLKTHQTESVECYKIFKRVVAANPNINFKLFNNNKLVFNFPASQQNLIDQDILQHNIKNRAYQLFGNKFIENSFYVDHYNEKISINGIFSIPTYNQNKKDDQYVVVNGRSIQDRNLTSLIRVAYAEVMPYGKHPSYIIYINVIQDEVDVNVSPTKNEVRFQDAKFIKDIIFKVIRHNIKNLINTSNTIASNLIKSSPTPTFIQEQLSTNAIKQSKDSHNEIISYNNIVDASISFVKESIEPFYNSYSSNSSLETEEFTLKKNINLQPDNEFQDYPLGFAKAQLHLNWIIAQNKDGIIIVDQHAAHERVSHERILQEYKTGKIVTQLLIVPEVINLDPIQINLAKEHQSYIYKLGIEYDIIGETSVLINSMPAILKNPNLHELFCSLLEDLYEVNTEEQFNKKVHSIISSIACHGSIRSGKKLSISEMNHLLRDMEKTDNFTQCSHGRPTFVELDIKNIERLFGRR